MNNEERLACVQLFEFSQKEIRSGFSKKWGGGLNRHEPDIVP